MKSVLWVSCACLFLLVGGSSARAQKNACPIPPPSPYKHTAYIGTRYDAVTNEMRTVLEHPVKLGREAQALYLSASFAYVKLPRVAVAPRTSVEFALISVAPAVRFRETHNLRLFVDGRELPRLAAEQYRSEQMDANLTVERTQISLSASALLELTEAKRVEVALGGERFELTKNHLEALRELASLIRPPAFTPAERKDAYLLPESGY